MRVLLESTTKIVELTENGQTVPARVWEGATESGIPVQVFVTRIAVERDRDASEFERELIEHRAPSRAVAELPLRLIL